MPPLNRARRSRGIQSSLRGARFGVMSGSDVELMSMEDNREGEGGKGSLPKVLACFASIPPSFPPSMTTVRPDFTSDSILESKAISMASNNCSTALSSPAEGSPAKPTETSTSIFEETFDKSPTTSHTHSASDHHHHPKMSIISISDVSTTLSSALPSSTFGSPKMESDFPPTLTFKGVSVTLENNSIWKQFHQCGTEMILTKQGRRMFPYCRYRLSGLDPERMYSLVLSIVPADQFKYRWNTSKWLVSGPTEHQPQGLVRAFSHHNSPCRGSQWMSFLVSFYKLKLTNNFQDQDGHIIMHSMHRYIPMLHVIPLPEEETPTVDKPLVMGPESITFTFPQTEFMAVTTYQNFHITQLKINHNPFAKSFREQGNTVYLQRLLTPAVKTDTTPEVITPTEPSEHKEKMEDMITPDQNPAASSSSVQETRLVLKPIMSKPSGTGYVPCIRGKHALGELVLVDKHPDNEPKEHVISGTPDVQQGLMMRSKAPVIPSSSTSTLRSAPRYRKRRRKIKRRWVLTYRTKAWKSLNVAASSPKVPLSPALPFAMQPELDDIEGLLFVSFTTKEALDVHVRDAPARVLPEPPVSSARPSQSKETVEVSPQTMEEKTAQLEQMLLNDLRSLRHRQVIHPVLQEVGLKLSSLDPVVPIDLNYLGVHLPLRPPSLPEQSSTSALPPADEGLPFISRTGKTSDMTKIKGWKNKFRTGQESSASNCEETQKNLSAFWSIMLDEYLESEAQQISERADAFSTNPEDSVAYQLPAKGSSYVKTLDSVLKHQKASSTPAMPNRPCPLSRKPLYNSTLRSPASPLVSEEPPGPSGAQPGYQDPAPSGSSCSRLSTSQSGASKRPEMSFSHKQLAAYRSLGLSQVQLKLLWMEIRAINQGLSRTQLTPERLMMALTVVLTKQTLVNQMLKGPTLPIIKAGPECCQEFCRLGCVCSSLQLLDQGPVHCRQPECMFGCTCSNIQPRQHVHTNKLWNRNINDDDSEPLYVPMSASSLHPKVVKGSGASSAPPIREKDKDPVYKYLESLMTCARVREFNHQPPPNANMDPDIAAVISKLSETTKPQDLTKKLPQKGESAALKDQKAEKLPQENTVNEKGVRKQIEIHSLCKWKKDCKMVLGGLLERLSQNRIHRRFWVGPYCISPVSKVVLRKPSGTVITYRVQISKLAKASNCEEDESVESDDYISDGNADPEEDDPVEEPERWCGITPFLGGVIPAGKLRAIKRPAFIKVSGLIQVNEKYYNHARLMLGSVGSLHPANRLASHVTGRLHRPHDIPQPETSTHSVCTFVDPNQKASQSLGFIRLKHHRQNSSTVNQRQTFVPIKPKLQNSSTSSPVHLTVSPSLKNPSFLGQSGTYSFRIFPPSNQVARGQNPPGLVLPGGFTLIELPKLRVDGAARQVKPVNTDDDSAQKKETVSNLSHSASESVGFNTLSKVKDFLSSRSSSLPSYVPLPDEKTPSGENNEQEKSQTQDDPNFDFTSEELSSDYSEDEMMENDDDTIDIETVEEEKQGEDIAKMREDASVKLEQRSDSSEDLTRLKEPDCSDENLALKNNSRRRKHKALEKLRRCEQKFLFSKLIDVLKIHHKTPRSHVLSQALHEILTLKATSQHLEQKKELLRRKQSAYMKQLSLFSGKCESVIQDKMQEIFERQKQREKKMKFKPFFSQLLETKAALLQATAPKSHFQSSLPQQHDVNPPLVPQAEPPHKNPDNLKMLLTLLHPTKPPQISSDQRCESTLQTPTQKNPQASPQGSQSPAQSNNRREEYGHQVTVSKSGSSDKTPPQAPSSQNGPTSGSFVAQKTKVLSPVPLAPLPLVRSKTGRIILPSSLKPLGKGFYTLMVVKPKKKAGDDVRPSDGDSSKIEEKTVSPTDQNSEQESKDVDEDKTSSSESDPKSSAGTTRVDELLFLNQSVSLPLLDLSASDKNQETSAVINPPSSAQLNPVTPPPSPGDLEPDPSPSPRRRRGRPLKNKGPLSTVINDTVVQEPNIKATDIKIPQLILRREGDERTLEVSDIQTEDAPVAAADKSAPVKRGRGRPPKRKPPHQLNTPGKMAARSPNTSTADRPIRFSIGNFKSPNLSNAQGEVYVSRPLTRASLGKDFPSEKKRSWIDVEKELEPDMEPDMEYT